MILHRKVRSPRVALVTDWLTDFGGAERVLLAMLELWPEAPIYTTLYRPANLPQLQAATVRTSYLQSIPWAAEKHRLFLPFMPAAVESFDLSSFDIVISSTATGCAKGVITKPGTLHLSYCHNPNRALWDGCHEYAQLHKFNPLLKLLIPRQLQKLRIWDRCAADRVDEFVTNSHFVAQRIAKYYQREATVIYPPVETGQYELAEKVGNYFLAVGRLIPYKRFDLAIQAANVLQVPLWIVGTGPEEARLKSIAGPTVKFLGKVSEEELRQIYAECQALIFPQVEDFGLTAVEVQATGRPVIAFRSGGALETIVPNRTGLFFSEQTVSSLADAMSKTASKKWVRKSIRKHAEQFDIVKFKQRFGDFVEERWQHWQAQKH